MSQPGNPKTFLSQKENDDQTKPKNEIQTNEVFTPSFETSSELNPSLNNDFVLIEDQDPPKDDLNEVKQDDFIEVSPKNSFMKKVSTAPKKDSDNSQNATFKSKIGRKDYAGGKLDFNKLRKNLFGGSLKGVWKGLFRTFGLFMILIVILGACGVGYILYLYQNIVFDSNVEQSKTSIILAADGKTELFKIYGTDGKRQEATWTEVPDQIKFAFLALEDENYYYNDSGISWYNLGGSILNCGTSLGKNCRGGSGISQQVVRKLTNDDTRQSGEVVQRKLREIVRAYKLNQSLSKEDILLKYLNVVPLGRNTIGIKEAVKSYFGKELKDVDIAEACYLATFPPSPSNYAKAVNNSEKDDKGDYLDPWREIMENRKNACIEKLSTKAIQGPGSEPLIPASEVKNLESKEVKFQTDQNIYKYPHFVEYVRTEIIDIFSKDVIAKEGLNPKDDNDIKYANEKAEKQLTTGGYKIVTTIDPVLQDKVENVIRSQAKKNILDVGADNAAAVVVDNTNGELLSMVGSLAYAKEDLAGIDGIKNPDEFYKELDGKVNIATSPQQPGSSFKPYTYATAFDKGLFNPTTVLMDVKTTFDNDGKPYNPFNFTGNFSGPVSIRYAIANSLNIPAIKAVYLSAGDNQNQSMTRVKNTGVNNVVNNARNMGVDFKVKEPEKNCGPQVALGGCEITMVSHATGMSTFARMGDKIPVSPFKQICTPTGEDIYNGKMCDGTEKDGIRKLKDEYYKKEEKVLDPKIAYEVVDMMTDVEARTPVFGSTRCTLTLNNCNRDKEFKDWVVAAKTGTSNENRDTWTVGFTPSRTALVWVGRTDNKPTNDSSMKSAAPIWQNVMRAAVSGQEKQDFNRPDGMVEIKVNPSSGLPVADGEQGISQWVTEDQKKKLEDSYNSIKDKASKGQLDLSKEDIFSLRSTIFSRTVEINKLDQKLVNDTNRNNIAPENIEKKSFACPTSEFPWAKMKDANNWQDPVTAYSNGANQDPNKPSNFNCGPTELSNTFRTDTTPEDKKPVISFEGFTNGFYYNSYPIRIVVNASTNVPGNVITDTQIFVNGEEKSAGKSSSSSYTIGGGPLDPTTLNIFFKANDNQGNSVTSPTYTITTLPAGAELPPDANKNPVAATTASPSPTTGTTTTTQPTPPPAVENPIKFDGINNGDTLSGNKDILVVAPSQITDPKVVFTSNNKNSSTFTPKELAINGFRYRASFDFSSFVAGDYTVKFIGKDSGGKAVSSDEIKVKVVK
jgi:membrane peptidoglycan carboxypeptidase